MNQSRLISRLSSADQVREIPKLGEAVSMVDTTKEQIHTLRCLHQKIQGIRTFIKIQGISEK
jgi:hypothetical protein